MHLKKALWSSVKKEGSNEAEGEDQGWSATVVYELVDSLNKQRLYREITLALRTSLRDACAEFSFLRLRGLRCLLIFLRSVSESDLTITLFCQAQSIPDRQVVPVLFLHPLKETSTEEDYVDNANVENLDCIFGVEPLKVLQQMKRWRLHFEFWKAVVCSIGRARSWCISTRPLKS